MHNNVLPGATQCQVMCHEQKIITIHYEQVQNYKTLECFHQLPTTYKVDDG